MSKRWMAFIGSIILISAITIGAVYASTSIKLIVNGKEVKESVPLHIANGSPVGSIKDVAEALDASVEWDDINQTVKITDMEKQELKRRLELLEFALISDSPEGVANTWAKGVMSRNGALQYAVLCDNLQSKYKSAYEGWNWLTGGSSPWIDEFVIESKEEQENGTWRFLIKFHWTDSTNYSKYSTHEVIIGKKQVENAYMPVYPGRDLKWCVISAEKTENLHTDNYTTNYTADCTTDRVVLLSIPSEVWHQNIYLIADKLNWMKYKNFTVQVGDMGEHVYNFPNWYHGKYEPGLYKEDINNDTVEDIIIVLNNDLAGPGKPIRDIHILNQIHDPYRRYEEARVEPIESTIDRQVKIEKHGDIVTILTGKKKYNINISKYNYTNPREPYISNESIEYSIKSGKLFGTIGAYVVRDDSVYGGFIGNFDIEYFWDGKMYKAKSIVFNEQSS